MAKKKTLFFSLYCTNMRDGHVCNAMNYTEARTELSEKAKRMEKDKKAAKTSSDLKNKYCNVCKKHTPHKAKRVHKAQPK
jgi:hypothetical protein